jgi:hypothetical protein
LVAVIWLSHLKSTQAGTEPFLQPSLETLVMKKLLNQQIDAA